MSYGIVEVFHTLQGEGGNTGRAAVFVRFAGCNLWSGDHQRREVDAARSGAACPMWCDTDFELREKMNRDQVVQAIEAAAAGAPVELIVLTGGEPLLQVDPDLVIGLRWAFDRAQLAVETNGTVGSKVPLCSRAGIDWVTVSPKLPVAKLRITQGTELKVVYPAYDPLAYEPIIGGFERLYVAPEAVTHSRGVSIINVDNTARAIAFCKRNPSWRLSVQTHKVLDLP